MEYIMNFAYNLSTLPFRVISYIIMIIVYIIYTIALALNFILQIIDLMIEAIMYTVFPVYSLDDPIIALKRVIIIIWESFKESIDNGNKRDK